MAGLAVGSSFGPSKLWTAEAFAEAGNALGQRGLRVALLYGPGEEGVATAVAGRLAKPPVLGPGKPLGLGGLKSVCSRLSVLVATDTGPRHVAVAFGVPVVVVMGPTDPLALPREGLPPHGHPPPPVHGAHPRRPGGQGRGGPDGAVPALSASP